MRSDSPRHRLSLLTLLALLLISAGPGASDGAAELAPFGYLVGGSWSLGDDFYQTFEWTVGKKAVRALGYAIVAGEARLVSEGMWFWHPGEEKIKGYFFNEGMPDDFMDFTTRFEGDRMVSEILAHNPAGKVTAYSEVVDLVGGDRYEWAVYAREAASAEPMMRGTFTRSTD